MDFLPYILAVVIVGFATLYLAYYRRRPGYSWGLLGMLVLDLWLILVLAVDLWIGSRVGLRSWRS